jgi:methyl-galactoside transport system substrate-binding protein
MKNKNFCLLSVCLFTLLSCAQGNKDVAFFIYNQDDTFMASLDSKVFADAEKQGLSYDAYYASLSQVTQNEQLAGVIEGGQAKVLAVNMVDRLAASSIISKAEAKDIPVLFYNRAPLEEDLLKGKSSYYVGTDPTYEGEAQGEMAASLFGDPASLASAYDKNGDGVIQLVIIKGEQGHQDTELRSRYCIKKLEDLGYQAEILTTAYANWTRSQAYAAMKDIYGKYGKQIELVFSNNDDMAVGALNFLVDQKVFTPGAEPSSQPFPVIGVDATEIGISYIKQGLMYGTIKNDAEGQASAISAFISYLVQGKAIDASFPYELTAGRIVSIKGQKVTKKDL